MILVEKNNSNEIAFTAVDQLQYATGFYKLKFKSSMTQQEKYVIPTVVTENTRYILLEFIESSTSDPDNGYINFSGGFYPNGQYTYELWETDSDGDELALVEKGEMKLLGENVSPEIQYFFYEGNNENASSYVYITPATPTPAFAFWNTTDINWELDTDNWETA